MVRHADIHPLLHGVHPLLGRGEAIMRLVRRRLDRFEAALLQLGDQRGERADMRHLEQQLEGDIHLERLIDSRLQLSDLERVSAQIEEMIIDADRLDAKQLLPDGRQLALRLVRRDRVMDRRPLLFLRPWQLGPVDLAVDRQRHPLQEHEIAGNHIFRQQLRQISSQPGRIQPAFRDDVGAQRLLSRRFLEVGDKRLFYLAMAVDAGFDLPSSIR